MGRLEAEGFGKLILKEKRGVSQGVHKSFFAKPHPDTLQEDTPQLKRNNLTLDTYTAAFNITQNLSEKDLKVVRDHHPHAELMNNILTQDEQDTSGSDSADA